MVILSIGSMTDFKLVSRTILIVLCIQYSIPTTAFEWTNFDHGKESKINLQKEHFESSHHRTRRQAVTNGCCTPPSCTGQNTAPYRTIDGKCNNLANPCWGAAGIPFRRLLNPKYEDGNRSPRGQGRSIPLPKPRVVAAGMVATNIPAVFDAITDHYMVWGQFIDHDLTFTPEINVTNCCSGSTDPNCIPLDVTDDAFYNRFNIRCLTLGRSVPSSCPPGLTREQFNEHTAFMDGSQIYGFSQAMLTNLRVANSYRLKISSGNENSGSCPGTASGTNCRFNFLPVRTNSASGNTEFFAGDNRLEEQPSLTSMHTVFMRMHNDLAEAIKFNNPRCTNEIVFQEARKIVGAVLQQITYDEFVPIMIGQVYTNSKFIKLGSGTKYNADGFFTGYDTTINPTVFNSFSTAAYRYGHSLVRNTFNLPGGTVNLAESFNNHDITLNPFTSPTLFMVAAASDPSEEMDHKLSDAVHNKLFATPPFEHGDDLYSRNIQRGRDHGLPGYKEWINFCKGPGSVTVFDDLYKFIPRPVVDKLKTIYGNRVDDVDLFPAGIAEFNIAGDALLGETFACLNARAFSEFKLGDRYWFERPGIFTKDQLASIRKTKLSTILCLYTFVQLNANIYQDRVMQPADATNNPKRTCNDHLNQGVLLDINRLWLNLCP